MELQFDMARARGLAAHSAFVALRAEYYGISERVSDISERVQKLPASLRAEFYDISERVSDLSEQVQKLPASTTSSIIDMVQQSVLAATSASQKEMYLAIANVATMFGNRISQQSERLEKTMRRHSEGGWRGPYRH